MMPLMQNKRGLIVGVANSHSIAWGIAQELSQQGAELAFTYQSEAFVKRVRPLAENLNSDIILECDVEDESSIDNLFKVIKEKWGRLDFIVHAIGFSDKEELKGRYIDVTSKENFQRTMLISAYSFTQLAQKALPLMQEGGSMLTLTYGGSVQVVPNYNVMGIAKAALEAITRYMASDLGPQNIRVNAISAGPIRTLAGNGIGSARSIFNYQKHTSPLRRTVNITEIGKSALYLLSDLASGVTGEIHYVDSGYNIMSMPNLDVLKQISEE